MNNLAPPTNPAGRLIEHPARRMAVGKCFGLADEARMLTKRQELLDVAAQAGLSPVSDPPFSFHGMPWTLPVLQRSDVWVGWLR